MDRRALHEQKVKAIQAQLQSAAAHSSRLCLANASHQSNTLRSAAYKAQTRGIGIDTLDKVIAVDPERHIALVEPRVTMEALVDATLPYHLVPAVVPEFKSITVGGAVNGAAIESSSHRYGQFNDICSAYDLLLAEGTRVRATQNDHSDLFYGISGCYGTLAFLTAAEIHLIPSKPWVHLDAVRFSSVAEAVHFIGVQHRVKNGPEYIEGIVYAKNDVVVIVGNQASSPTAPVISLSSSSSPWYYQLMRHRTGTFSMTIRDYLFRHDRAAFWMGGYALNSGLLSRYILELTHSCPAWLHRRFMTGRAQSYVPRDPGVLFRSLFGWMMDSAQLYGFLHRHTEQWFADHFVIQDYYLPEGSVPLFADYLFDHVGIFPLWLCPVKATSMPQWLSPHYADGSGVGLWIDVGVYGMPSYMQHGEAVSRGLDTLAVQMGGRKMLYSHSYYTPEEFWQIYPQERYRALRRQYRADALLMEITDKVLVRREYTEGRLKF